MATLSAVQNAPQEQRALNPFVSYDPHAMHTSNARWSRVWKVAALVTAAAFIALAVFAVIYTTAHFPVHLPTVSIIVFAAGMPTSFRAFKYLWDKKDACAAEAAIDKRLIQEMDLYKEKSPTAVYQDVKINSGLEEKKLESAFARYGYFEKEKQRHLKDCKELLNAADSPPVSQVDFTDKKEVKAFEDTQKRRVLAKGHLREAAICHLKAAYFLHVIENPYENRPLAKFFQLVTASYPQRLVAKDHGDRSPELLLKTPNKTYTAHDILGKGADKLRAEVFEGKVGFWS